MQAHLTKDGNKVLLKLSGRFDFNPDCPLGPKTRVSADF
jgi:hypothetical protein